MQIGKDAPPDQLKQALVRFDAFLKETERRGIQTVSVSALRKNFDDCLDKFEIFASELSTWNQEVL